MIGSDHDLIVLAKDSENYGAPQLLENLDPVLVRAQLDPVHFLQSVPRLDPGLLQARGQPHTIRHEKSR